MFMDYEEFASLQLDKPIPDVRVSNIVHIIHIHFIQSRTFLKRSIYNSFSRMKSN